MFNPALLEAASILVCLPAPVAVVLAGTAKVQVF